MTDQADESTKADVEAVAYRLLARRDHARRELADKLRRRHFDTALIEEVLDECAASGYLDDRRFSLHQGGILARKCWGPLQIRQKLRLRGVAADIIDDTLETLRDDFDWEHQARDRLHCRFDTADKLDTDDRARAYRHLTYRGYPSALVRRILFDH